MQLTIGIFLPLRLWSQSPLLYFISVISKSKYLKAGSVTLIPMTSNANMNLEPDEKFRVDGVGSEVLSFMKEEVMEAMVRVSMAVIINRPMKTLMTRREQMPPEIVE